MDRKLERPRGVRGRAGRQLCGGRGGDKRDALIAGSHGKPVVNGLYGGVDPACVTMGLSSTRYARNQSVYSRSRRTKSHGSPPPDSPCDESGKPTSFTGTLFLV